MLTRYLRFTLFIVPAAMLIATAVLFTAIAYMLIYAYRWTLTDLASKAGNWSLRLGQRVETALDLLEASLRIIAERLRG